MMKMKSDDDDVIARNEIIGKNTLTSRPRKQIERKDNGKCTDTEMMIILITQSTESIDSYAFLFLAESIARRCKAQIKRSHASVAINRFAFYLYTYSATSCNE